MEFYIFNVDSEEWLAADGKAWGHFDDRAVFTSKQLAIDVAEREARTGHKVVVLQRV